MFAHSQGAERGEEEVISLMINVSVVLAQDANTCKASRLTHTRTHTHLQSLHFIWPDKQLYLNSPSA